MDEEYLEENMSFLSSIPWRAVFDTGSDGKVYQYMKSKGKLFRNRECEDLDPHTDCNVQAPEKVDELKEDIRSSPQASWIFTNGSEEIKSETMELKKWKQFRKRGFREFIDFYGQELQTSRCIFVFVLLSKDYDISLEVADEISATFKNQFLCIAETSQIAEPWMDKLVDKYDVDKDALELRTVSGLDWHHVSAIIDEISEKELTSEIQLTTKGGASIILPDLKKNEWADLDILSAKECEGVIKDEKELDALRVEKEKHFYRGGCADWWNYYFKTQVCTRTQHERLKRMVQENLEGKAFQADEGIGQVTLYHQPGAGGTTSAKHVLWDLKTEYRCAEVKHITRDTFDQITQFHNYKESAQEGAVPKPVLLLLDNPDEEKAKNLIKKMKEKARSTYSEGQQLFCVLLLVLRKKTATLLPEDDSFYTLALKHQLDQVEQTWFNTTYSDIEQRKENDPKTLVAFNILKENFDKSYIERTVRGIVKNITDDKEVKLLKMLSLLNMYDVYKRPVPTSAFDHFMNQTTLPKGQKYSWGIMGSHLRPDIFCLWENHLSESIRILLNVNSGYIHAMKLKTLCIFHPLMSEAILNILRQEKLDAAPELDSSEPQKQIVIPLSDVVSEVLFLPFLTFKTSGPIKSLLQINIAGILKNRERESSGKLGKFSPLVQEIWTLEGTVPASEVLKLGFERTDDVFVCQQLARILIEGKNWGDAEYYAKMATETVKDNSRLWHTRGQVFFCQLKEKLQRIKDSMSPTYDNRMDILKSIDLARSGVVIFQKVQDLANKKDTSRNLAGHFSEMKIFKTLLECLHYLPCFYSDELSLKRFLCDPDYTPYEIRKWSNLQGVDYIAFLKKLRICTFKRFQSIDDELTQLKGTYLDSYEKREHQRNNERLADLQEPLRLYLGSDVDNVQSHIGQAGTLHHGILNLKDVSLGRIFSEGRCPDGRQRLASLLKTANILHRQSHEMAYLRCVIGISLVHGTLFPWIDETIPLDELREWSTKLYHSQSIHRTLEPYLFFVALNWNSGKTNPKQIQEAIKKWETAYHTKYENHPNRDKPRDVFFLGKACGLQSLVSSSNLRYVVRQKHKKIPFFKDPDTASILRRIPGRLENYGRSLLIDVKFKGHSDTLEVKLDRPISNSLYFRKPANFFLGFSWTGPKAFDVMPGTLEEHLSTKVLAPTKPEPQRYHQHQQSFTRGILH